MQPASYRDAFEHEITANHAMLKMLDSVPEPARGDARFQQAVNIADHMVACREAFLHVFLHPGAALGEMFRDDAEFAPLEERFTKMEAGWKAYLDDLKSVEGFYEFSDNGEGWRLSLQAQLTQLMGHAAYHRGQVVLLVDQLGGETVNTDYIDWFTSTHPDGWEMASV